MLSQLLVNGLIAGSIYALTCQAIKESDPSGVRAWGQASLFDSAEKPPFAKILGDQKSLTQPSKSIVGHL